MDNEPMSFSKVDGAIRDAARSRSSRTEVRPADIEFSKVGGAIRDARPPWVSRGLVDAINRLADRVERLESRL